MRGQLLTFVALAIFGCTPPPPADGLAVGSATASNNVPSISVSAPPIDSAAALSSTAPSATPTAPDPEPEELGGLKATLISAKVGADGISVTFVLRNVGSKPLHVFERWNSWGADQWTIEVEEAAGNRVIALNPQQAWTKNFPSALKIEPGEEHRMLCVILPAEPEFWKSQVDYFVPRPPVPAFTAPTRVRGVFDTKGALQQPEDRIGVRAGGTITSKDIWNGRIATAWQSVKP